MWIHESVIISKACIAYAIISLKTSLVQVSTIRRNSFMKERNRAKPSSMLKPALNYLFPTIHSVNASQLSPGYCGDDDIGIVS